MRDERPLFREKIRAWANGPVCRALYALHKGKFVLDHWPQGNSKVLTPNQRSTVDAVLRFYGSKSPQWLSDLTHLERPWREARLGLADGDSGNVEITHAAMAEYYGGLPPA